MAKNKLQEMQITQWDFQNKGMSGWTGTSSFPVEVPLRNLRPSVIYSVPCDRIVQRAYSHIKTDKITTFACEMPNAITTLENKMNMIVEEENLNFDVAHWQARPAVYEHFHGH